MLCKLLARKNRYSHISELQNEGNLILIASSSVIMDSVLSKDNQMRKVIVHKSLYSAEQR
jgi:hypothetical protein